jgi:hypothetical protein
MTNEDVWWRRIFGEKHGGEDGVVMMAGEAAWRQYATVERDG